MLYNLSHAFSSSHTYPTSRLSSLPYPTSPLSSVSFLPFLPITLSFGTGGRDIFGRQLVPSILLIPSHKCIINSYLSTPTALFSISFSIFPLLYLRSPPYPARLSSISHFLSVFLPFLSFVTQQKNKLQKILSATFF